MWQRLFLVLSLFLNIFLGARFLASHQGLPGYRELNRQQQALEEEVAATERQNVLLTREIRLLENSARHVRRLIRERLRSVGEDEVLYLFPETDDGPKDRAAGA